MKRTQIYIDEATYEYLEKESEIEKKSISELIRESLKGKMKLKIEDIIKNVDEVSGIWKDLDFNVNEYIEDKRRDRTI